ncbi:protein FAM161B isoform X3 [Pteropus vampyrus]|uniref:Ectonucleoside triphosphate diphosphohydrolase 5 n=1 Tax=Pteropus vampyrus TaxID=132908 RepID=A0A6P6CZN1_PTEVA|nr:protein FAM161B isoform X3 [Pteropus vampyrus]
MATSWGAAFFMLVASCVCSTVFHRDQQTWFEGIFLSSMCPVNVSASILYGIMFDAGSTGTRIHVYTFVQKIPGQLPVLEGEIFDSVKPGLSAFVDQPKQGAETVQGLLEVAKDSIPRSHWKKTPVVLKATAGLRLLPEQKAQALLFEVQEIFKKSPFLVPNDSVSIMDGSYEGVLAWITVNFLTGQLHGHSQETVGTLDLGGASTQITFLPQLQKTLEQTPRDYLTSFEMFNSTYKLYTHSYLGFGLKAARLATLGALATEGIDAHTFRSACLPRYLEAEWIFGGVKYQYGGNQEGEVGFEPCYAEVLRVVQGKLHQPDEIHRSSFYAFSYYYDRAVDTDMIDYEKGGVLKVEDFERKAREVCDNLENYTSGSPFLCMDLSYITALLKDGFGFADNTILKVFPPKSSSDTEAEEELSGDVLVLPRAGKLDEFLSPEETDSTSSDSTGSIYETLQVLKQKSMWCLLESLYQSDPDSDDNFSADDEDLKNLFQDKGMGKPQVQYIASPRCGSTRRCSSLSSLPSNIPKDQSQPPSGSRPPSQHRNISSWASSITVPRPFRMTLREAQKKVQWLASPASFERERQQAQKQGQEEAECHRQFRAQPVPAHVYLPLYQEIMERNEARRQTGIQKRKELLLSSLKPFSFLEKEEQQKEAAQQRELAATAKAKVSKQKATRRIPKSILEPALGDKLQEAELFRKIRIQMRALDMLQMASSPITSSSRRADPQLRTAARTSEEKLGFLQTNFGFQPRVNPAVPDYEALYKAFQRRAAKRRNTREVTRNKPFLLRTASLRSTQRPCEAATAGERRDSPQSPATPRPRSHSLSGLASLSANTLPVHITDATRKRESAVRNNDRKRAKEYKKELEEMKKRLQTRPYLFEQVTKDLARKGAEQRYHDTLKQAGLDEDFVRNKGQGTRATQWKGQSEGHDYPSTHETTKLGTRNPQQDLEDSLEQPTSPKKELEELSYELLDNLKSLS